MKGCRGIEQSVVVPALDDDTMVSDRCKEIVFRNKNKLKYSPWERSFFDWSCGCRATGTASHGNIVNTVTVMAAPQGGTNDSLFVGRWGGIGSVEGSRGTGGSASFVRDGGRHLKMMPFSSI